MFDNFSQRLYFLKWFFQIRVLGARKPLQTVLGVSDKCNLRCAHCSVVKPLALSTTKTCEQIERELRECFRMGSRFVDFEGGEPFLWRDGTKTIDDLCALAKRLGFFSATITTNAQLPFDAPNADLIWVSLDGVGARFDEIRGQGAFERLERNVEATRFPRLNANMVVNRINFEDVDAVVDYVWKSPFFNELSVNFHTPFPGTESLELDWDARRKVIDLLIERKKKGAPITNTFRGLRGLKDMSFTKRCWIANFVSVDGSFSPCCPGRELGICDRCGFGMATEMTGIYNLSFETILAGLNLRKRNPKVNVS
ncbi:MAG: radical SAM protein [Thermoguttaceae bacterium]|nr:radical SAM protein [Thermoguttaceae bacterium]